MRQRRHFRRKYCLKQKGFTSKIVFDSCNRAVCCGHSFRQLRRRSILDRGDGVEGLLLPSGRSHGYGPWTWRQSSGQQIRFFRTENKIEGYSTGVSGVIFVGPLVKMSAFITRGGVKERKNEKNHHNGDAVGRLRFVRLKWYRGVQGIAPRPALGEKKYCTDGTLDASRSRGKRVKIHFSQTVFYVDPGRQFRTI